MLDEVIAELERLEAKSNASDQAFVLRQQMLDELSPALWSNLRKTVKAKCAQYAERLAFEIQPERQIVVRSAKGGAHLEATYMPRAKRICYQIGEKSGEYRIGLGSNDAAIFMDVDGIPYPSVDFVAEHMLIGLLR